MSSEEAQCSPDRPCTAVQLLIQRADNQDERMDKMEHLMDSLRNRLPLWATMAFTAAGTTIGILAAHIR